MSHFAHLGDKRKQILAGREQARLRKDEIIQTHIRFWESHETRIKALLEEINKDVFDGKASFFKHVVEEEYDPKDDFYCGRYLHISPRGVSIYLSVGLNNFDKNRVSSKGTERLRIRVVDFEGMIFPPWGGCIIPRKDWYVTPSELDRLEQVLEEAVDFFISCL